MRLPHPKAIIFDLDDTLIAFEAVSDASWVTVCATFSASEASAQQLLAAIDREREWYWSDPERHRIGRKDLVKARRNIVNSALDSIGRNDVSGAEIADTYTAVRTEAVHLLPGAIALLDALADRQLPLLLVTNGTRETQREKIERFSLEPYFADILVEGECGFGKPDPRIYQLALDSLGMDPQDIWFVGDNLEWDVFAPQRTGMTGVWHNYDGRALPKNQEQKPDFIIESIGELLDLTFTTG